MLNVIAGFPGPGQFKQYSLRIDEEKARRVAEVLLEFDRDGQVSVASYDTGEQLRRSDLYTVVKTATSMFWLGDRFGQWHPLD